MSSKDPTTVMILTESDADHIARAVASLLELVYDTMTKRRIPIKLPEDDATSQRNLLELF